MRMRTRFSKRNAATVLGLGAMALVWQGCEGKKQTEYVAGVSTQVQVPRDLRTIRVDVNVGGVPVFCRAYKVYDGKVQLPRSLGSFPASESSDLGTPITVTIVGYDQDISAANLQDQYQCFASTVPGQDARILRRSRQPYVQDQILFLPLALTFSCFDTNCEQDGAQDKTCKAGVCVDDTLDPHKLPVFDPTLVDGTGAACFHASQCFATAEPPVTVTDADCTYALPNTASAPPVPDGGVANPLPPLPGDGINVEVVYDGGYVQEILDKDDAEGFSVPDPTKPQQFRLTPGLCNMVHGDDGTGNPTPHRITAIRASAACQAKGPFLPICADDQLAAMGVGPDGVSANASITDTCKPIQLKPAPAGLVVVADDLQNSVTFFSSNGEQAALSLSLSDPAFERTTIGLDYYPGADGNACTSHGPVVSPEPAKKAQNDIANEILTHAPTAASPNGVSLAPLNNAAGLDQALTDAYGLFADPTKFDANLYARGVLVIGNRGFVPATTTQQNDQCSTAPPGQTLSARATTAFGNGIKTYVVLLSLDHGAAEDEASLVGGANALAQGGSGGKLNAYDGRSNASNAQPAFTQIVDDLATCVYGVDSGALPGNGDVLSYSDPITGATTAIPFNASCNSGSSTAAGWGLGADGKHVFVCGSACDDYQTTLSNAASYAALNLQPALAVPMFSHKAACAPKATSAATGNPAPPTDAGGGDASSGSLDASTGNDGGG